MAHLSASKYVELFKCRAAMSVRVSGAHTFPGWHGFLLYNPFITIAAVLWFEIVTSGNCLYLEQ